MEKVRFSYDQNNTIEDVDKLLTHMEKLGYHIVQWYTSGGMLHMHIDRRNNE